MKVLLPVDDSEGTQRTLNWVVQFLDRSKVRIYLLHVIYWTVDALVRAEEFEKANQVLTRSCRFFENYGFPVDRSEYVLGTPSRAICEYADKHGVDQIIIGSHGHQGLARILLGSVSRGVFKCASQPVLLFNNMPKPSLEVSRPFAVQLHEAPSYPHKVLMPVDGSRGSKRTLEWAAGFLDKDKTTICLLNVYDFTPEGRHRYPSVEESQRFLQESRSFLEEHGFRQVESTMVHGSPGQTICDYADNNQVDQIIIGSHGNRGIGNFLMGSTTRAVFECADQPVIVLNNTDRPTLRISHPEDVHLTQQEM